MKVSYVVIPLVALVTAPLAGLFFVTIPDGCNNAIELRLRLGTIKLFTKISAVLSSYYGPDYGVNFTRRGIDFATSRKPTPLPNPNLKVTSTIFNGVPVRVYEPSTLPPDGPAMVWYHGGGWVFGNIDLYDELARLLAEETAAVIVTVEYRLAPENPYPIPRMDCEAATKYFMDHALDYGVDPEKIAIAGDSAGGNLAAAISLSLRNQEFYPRPKQQILVYPALQAVDFNTPSNHLQEYHPLTAKIGTVSVWLRHAFGSISLRDQVYNNLHTSPAMKKEIKEKYLPLDRIPKEMIPKDYSPTPDHVGNATLWAEIEHVFMDPLFAPLMADDLSDLPNALVITVEHDILRDDGIFYSERLKEAGVKTQHKHYKHTTHGILSFVEMIDSKQMRADLVKFFKDHI